MGREMVGEEREMVGDGREKEKGERERKTLSNSSPGALRVIGSICLTVCVGIPYVVNIVCNLLLSDIKAICITESS
jgi:hypothetical protein